MRYALLASLALLVASVAEAQQPSSEDITRCGGPDLCYAYRGKVTHTPPSRFPIGYVILVALDRSCPVYTREVMRLNNASDRFVICAGADFE